MSPGGTAYRSPPFSTVGLGTRWEKAPEGRHSCLAECVAPPGLSSRAYVFPQLKLWATLFRPSGTDITGGWRTLSPSFFYLTFFSQLNNSTPLRHPRGTGFFIFRAFALPGGGRRRFPAPGAEKSPALEFGGRGFSSCFVLYFKQHYCHLVNGRW
jgi:hypothetical protein